MKKGVDGMMTMQHAMNTVTCPATSMSACISYDYFSAARFFTELRFYFYGFMKRLRLI